MAPRIVETTSRRHHRATLKRAAMVGAFCLGIAASKALALVSLNDGHDKFFVNGVVSFAWDSNVYANKESQGDYVMSATTGVDYTRRAGLIGVDASIAVNASKYNKFSTEDFRNPKLSLEFTKQTGRTTGSLRFSAARESKADPNANLRTHAWTYDVGLNVHYPVIERYSLTGGLDATSHRYDNNAQLVNLNTYAANLDLLYILSETRDLEGGVRVRQENTSVDSKSIDTAYTVGVRGRIIPRVNGSLNVGLQNRTTSGRYNDSFNSWTANVSATWNATRRYQVSATISKDFNTTSTDASTDVLTFDLQSTYAMNAHLSFGAGAGAGITHFLGVVGAGRRDTYFDYSLSVNYSLNDHLKASFQYTYFKNWSTLDFATFVRQGYSFTVASRW